MRYMRLNRYIAMSGKASRRKAEEFILNGNIKVNGKVVNNLSYIVQEGDIVELNGKVIEPEKKVYFALNKPALYICSNYDKEGRAKAVDLIETDERLFSIGRLDYDSEGLLLLTNDGELAYKLSHPKYNVEKVYIATVEGVVSEEKARKLSRGVVIDGYKTAPGKFEVMKYKKNQSIVRVQIKEGKNRQIRKMFASVGNNVVNLKRISIGNIHLGHLRTGHYRKLTEKEIISAYSL